MAVYGVVDQYDLNGKEKITEYVERLEQYFYANDIEDAKKQTAIFLTVVGAETYSLLRSLLSPTSPHSKDYKTLAKTLTDHLLPTPILIAERHKFYSRNQEPGETLSEYIAHLRSLTEHCQFREFLTEALRDRFVCGLANPQIRKVLLTKKDLDLKKALEVGLSIEKAELENITINESADVHRCEKTYTVRSEVRRRCYRCNSEFHLANRCKFKTSICNTCNIKGHLAAACRSKYVESKKGGRKFPIHNVQKQTSSKDSEEHGTAVSGDDENEVYYIQKLYGSVNPYKIEMVVDNQSIEFEIDTGSGITIISESCYNKLFPNEELRSSKMTVKTYSNEILPVLGKRDVDVTYNGIKYGPLKLVILKGEGVNLLGRNWINQIRIDWRCVTKPEGTGVHKTECDIEDTKIDREVQNLIGKYPKIFEDRVGRMKGYQAKINLKKGAVPKYCKARSVPFAVQEAVTNELDRLEKEGVIESIPYSEWASPIAVVPKPDG